MNPFLAWLPASVRTRLLLAFSVLFVSTMVLGLVGWWGMRDTRDALRDFQSHVLPNIARSLELAQRAASLAAMAPYVAETNQPFQLQSEADALRARLRQAARLSEELPLVGIEVLDLQPALKALDSTIEELIEVTRQDLFLREDLRERLYRLQSAREALPSDGANERDLDALYRDLLAITSVDDPQVLALLQDHVNRQLKELVQTRRRDDGFLDVLREQAEGQTSTFALRQRQQVLQERKAFLLARTRAEAERLGERVNAYVDAARGVMDRQGVSVNRAVRSGIFGIALLTLVCVVVATLGVRVVDRMVRSLVAITRVMSRLAEGDIEQSMPAAGRRDELGALARAFEVFRDNARAVRRMAVDLKEQSRLLASVFDNIKDGLSVFDGDGRLVTCNRQYLSLLELPSEAAEVGTPVEVVQTLLPPLAGSAGAERLTMAGLNVARQKEPYSFELAYPSGKVVEFRSNPMPGGGFVTLYNDLTERRAVEAQLRQSQKMEVLGQLTGGVAHDFNNLLAAIMGNLYLLEGLRELSGPAGRFTARARAAAERGAALTRRLLAFARRQTLSPQAERVDDLISEMADLIEYSVGEGVALLFELNAPDVCAWVDRGQLENALLNLALNARDAMPEGGQLAIRTGLDEASDRIRIAVTDTGCGIAESMQERVFEPFFTTKAGSGSGLGLSIVYGFVKQSGGDIVLSSRVGEGTTFSLWLPRHHARPEAVVASSNVAVPVPPQTILLVEDDPDVRQTVADLLVAAGHTVVPVASASEALARLAEAPPSLVLSDVDLGHDSNGVVLMREIASLDPALPRILMSGLPAEHLSTRFGLTDEMPLLAKPFKPGALAEALRRVLNLG